MVLILIFNQPLDSPLDGFSKPIPRHDLLRIHIRHQPHKRPRSLRGRTLPLPGASDIDVRIETLAPPPVLILHRLKPRHAALDHARHPRIVVEEIHQPAQDIARPK